MGAPFRKAPPPPEAGEHLVRDRIVDHAADGFVPAPEGDGDGVVLAVEEVGRPVDGVDEPAVLRVAFLDRGELLAGQAPVGRDGEEAFADQRLGRAVGFGDEVAGALDADLDVAEAGEMRLREGGGLADDGFEFGRGWRRSRWSWRHGGGKPLRVVGGDLVGLERDEAGREAEAFRRHALDRVGVDAAACRVD